MMHRLTKKADIVLSVMSDVVWLDSKEAAGICGLSQWDVANAAKKYPGVFERRKKTQDTYEYRRRS